MQHHLKRKSNKAGRSDLGLDALLKTKLWEELTLAILEEMEKGPVIEVTMKELDNIIKEMSKRGDIEKAVKNIKKALDRFKDEEKKPV